MFTTTMASLAKNSTELGFNSNLTEESAVSPGAISSGRISGRSSISNSPSSRKRVHPTSLNIDDETPPNKRLRTPTQEEKESILREKQILYKRLAEAEKTPFYLSPHQGILPFLPFSGSISPIYSLLQQQQQTSSPCLPTSASPRRLTTCGNATTSSTTGNLNAANLTTTSSSQQSSYDSTASSLGITGLPTPGGSSVSTPSFPMQFYPATLMKYPFSPPTPSSLSLSPWNASSNSNVEGTTTTTGGSGDTTESTNITSRGGAKPHDISTGQTVVANQKNGSTLSNNSSMDTNSNSNNEGASTNSADGEQTRSSPKSSGSNIPVAPSYTWQTASGLQNSPHIMSPHSNFMSAPSPLSCLHPSPLSPMMLIHSPYTSSISSCLSVGSSSGFSSASEGAGVSANGSQIQGASYAPSEYHVGPQRPLSERLADEIEYEGASNSGRNTPVDVSSEDNEENLSLAPDLHRVSQNVIASNSRTSSAPYHPLNSSVHVQQAPNETSRRQPAHHHSSTTAVSSYPFSVESLSASQPSSVNSQGYLGNIHQSSSIERPSSGVSSMSSSLSSRGSTPEPPEELKPDPYQPPLGGDVFCMVPGRLSLLSSTQKYKVTVDEVRRRLSHPECLNASVLGGILRRAKSKNGGHILRQRLESIGVSLPPGRRKATELSLLTSLVEGESLHLASDFRRLCENYFPQSELAQIIASQHSGTPEAEHRISMVKATQLIVSELQAMLNAVGGPSNIRPNDPNNPYPGLTNFSLLSHGFGNPTINTSLNVLQTYLQELLAFYEGRKPLPTQDGRYAYNTAAASNHKVPSTGQSRPSHHQSGGGGAHCHSHLASNSLLQGSDVAITSVRGGMGMILKQEPVEPSSGCIVVQHRSVP